MALRVEGMESGRSAEGQRISASTAVERSAGWRGRVTRSGTWSRRSFRETGTTARGRLRKKGAQRDGGEGYP